MEFYPFEAKLGPSTPEWVMKRVTEVSALCSW
jgi:hypothetical protein